MATTLELPRIKRARGGWAIYGTGEDSICPYHQFCAFTGDERNLCQICHATHPTDEHGDLPPKRLAPCLCAKCGELFTSVTGFTVHIGPGFKCRNPERRGLVLVEQNGWSMWAKPGSPPPRD